MTDVNDRILTFSQSEYTANVNEYVPANRNVNPGIAVAAGDKDATEPNNLFMFSIDSGNTNDAFNINTVRRMTSGIQFL